METIHKNNTRVIAQINHAGSAAMEEITGYPAISASVTAQPEYARKSEKPVREMTADDMHTVAKKFAEAALRVKEAGFDGVEIHAAHEYLLDQFYSPLGNKRPDAYGGDLDGRIHLLLDVIRAVREAVGADYLVALRLGASDYTEGGATIDDAVYACKKFEKAGVDLLDISGGFNGFTVKNRKDPGFFSDASSAIREAVHVPVILTGGVTKANEAEALLEEGAAADIIVTDYDPLTPLTADNINGHTLFGMSGRQTVTTVIDGKVRMQDRELVDIDEKKILAEARAHAQAMWNRINSR